jgi:hypothetical protein
MNPLTIAANDYLNVSFTNNALGDVLITNVTSSTVNGQTSYAVTAGGKVYTCTVANCTIREKVYASGQNTYVKYWVLGA